jgi:hypothetical protein
MHCAGLVGDGLCLMLPVSYHNGAQLMAIKDIYNGAPGEWRGGMWFPDPHEESTTTELQDYAQELSRLVRSLQVRLDTLEHYDERLAHDLAAHCHNSKSGFIAAEVFVVGLIVIGLLAIFSFKLV